MWYPRTVFLLFFAGRALIDPASGWRLPILRSSCSFLGNVSENCAFLPGPHERSALHELGREESLGCRAGGSCNASAPWRTPGSLKVSLLPNLQNSPLDVSTLDCGRPSLAVPLIVNGVVGSPATHPWHVGIYRLFELKFDYWCGGSLISKFVVLTAAHCTWNVAPEKLVVAVGKFYRDFDAFENLVQKIRAKTVKTLPSYQDAEGNYYGDISLIFLQEAAGFNDFVRPICLDWSQEFVDSHLAEGALGVVAGWGLTENDTFSDTLRVLKIPVVSDEKCIAEQPTGFKKYVTYTSFCAGFKNGSGVCNGDSGGGLAFFDRVLGRWYLQGLVSVSPRKKGTSYCDPNSYTVFTKVAMFTEWLRKMMNVKEKMGTEVPEEKQKLEKDKDIYEHINKYFTWQRPLEKGFHSGLPHTDKLSKLAGLSQSQSKE